MVLFCSFGSGYATFPGERGRRCGGASLMLSEPVRPLSWVKPLGMVVLPRCSMTFTVPFSIRSFYLKQKTKQKNLSVGPKIQHYRTTTFNLDFNYLHILLWDTPSMPLCSSMRETGQRSFINPVKYLPTRFNTAEPDVWCVMIKRQGWLFVSYICAFGLGVLKRPRLL